MGILNVGTYASVSYCTNAAFNTAFGAGGLRIASSTTAWSCGESTRTSVEIVNTGCGVSGTGVFGLWGPCISTSIAWGKEPDCIDSPAVTDVDVHGTSCVMVGAAGIEPALLAWSGRFTVCSTSTLWVAPFFAASRTASPSVTSPAPWQLPWQWPFVLSLLPEWFPSASSCAPLHCPQGALG